VFCEPHNQKARLRHASILVVNPRSPHFQHQNREPFLTPEIDAELYPYIASIFKAMKSPALIINGSSDHLHMLFSLARVVTLANLVEEVKTESSKWIKTKGREFRNFHGRVVMEPSPSVNQT
jgi:REP element-mobilizing transposase RayT